jgi:hypothetical protein
MAGIDRITKAGAFFDGRLSILRGILRIRTGDWAA